MQIPALTLPELKPATTIPAPTRRSLSRSSEEPQQFDRELKTAASKLNVREKPAQDVQQTESGQPRTESGTSTSDHAVERSNVERSDEAAEPAVSNTDSANENESTPITDDVIDGLILGATDAPVLAQRAAMVGAASAPASATEQGAEGSVGAQTETTVEPPRPVIQDEKPAVNQRAVVEAPLRSAVATTDESITIRPEAAPRVEATPQPTTSTESTSPPQADRPTESSTGDADVGQHDPKGESQTKGYGTSALLDREVQSTEATPAVARADQVDAGVRLAQLDRSGPGAGQQTSVGLPVSHAVASSPNPGMVGVVPSTDGAEARETQSANPVTSRAIKGMTAMLGHRGGVMTMRLDPPELGQLRIQMAVQSARVSVQFEVQSIQASTLLRDGMTQLRASLEQHGLSVDRLTVNTTQPQPQADTGDRSSTSRDDQHDPDAGRGQSRGRNDDASRRSQTDQEPQTLKESFAQWMGSSQAA